MFFELTELDPDVQAAFETAGVEVNGLFNEEDLKVAAEELEPNSSAALLVWENVWATKVAGDPRRWRRAPGLRAFAARSRASGARRGAREGVAERRAAGC
jgi:hypothetical protein